MAILLDAPISLHISDGTTMRGYVARPKASERAPGLVVLQEAFGVNSYIKSIVQRFAKEGYVAMAPELFHRTAPGFEGDYTNFESVRPHTAAITSEGLNADLLASYQWLTSDPQVKPNAIACIGFCMGGRAAYLMNALLPIQAAISFYGAGIAPTYLDKAASLQAPMLFFWGGRDKNITPEQHINPLLKALREQNKKFVNVEFSDSGHGFFNDARTVYDPKAAAQAWPLCLEFLKSNLPH